MCLNGRYQTRVHLRLFLCCIRDVDKRCDIDATDEFDGDAAERNGAEPVNDVRAGRVVVVIDVFLAKAVEIQCLTLVI